MKRIFYFTLGLVLVLIIIRAEVIDFTRGFSLLNSSEIRRLAFFSFHDVVYSLVLGGAFLTIVFFIKNKRAESFIFISFIGFIYISILWATVNIHALSYLNTPINYQLWYYSDIVDSDYLSNSIESTTYWEVFIKSIIGFTVAAGFGLAALWLSGRVNLSKRVQYILGTLIVLAFSVYTYKAYKYSQALKESFYDEYAKLENPVFSFAKSLSAGNGDFNFKRATDEELDKYYFKSVNRQSAVAQNPKVKHVILFVLESIQADYVAGYKNQFDLTPEIDKHLNDALIVENAYAHSPNSSNSLFSLLNSTYPLLSFKNVIKEHPDFPGPTLNSELNNKGFRSAFFTTADNSYMGLGEYLSFQKFDKVQDYREINCSYQSFSTDAEGVGEVKNEACMVDSFLKWADSTWDSRPFFGVLWTIQTHWPYFVFGKEKEYVKDNPDLNKYLNAIRETDAAFGKLVEGLKKSGKYDSTLIVLVGDHGEAFGQHKQFGHGSNIYEENIKVPLIFINPTLFGSQRKSIVAGHIDVAPTILDILGFASPKEWLGTSIFDDRHANKAYFFSIWSDYLYGSRSGDYKVIYDIYRGKTTVYNLKNDPEEKINIAGTEKKLREEETQELSKWVNYHQIYMDRILQKNLSE